MAEHSVCSLNAVLVLTGCYILHTFSLFVHIATDMSECKSIGFLLWPLMISSDHVTVTTISDLLRVRFPGHCNLKRHMHGHPSSPSSSYTPAAKCAVKLEAGLAKSCCPVTHRIHRPRFCLVAGNRSGVAHWHFCISDTSTNGECCFDMRSSSGCVDL